MFSVRRPRPIRPPMSVRQIRIRRIRTVRRLILRSLRAVLRYLIILTFRNVVLSPVRRKMRARRRKAIRKHGQIVLIPIRPPLIPLLMLRNTS